MRCLRCIHGKECQRLKVVLLCSPDVFKACFPTSRGCLDKRGLTASASSTCKTFAVQAGCWKTKGQEWKEAEECQLAEEAAVEAVSWPVGPESGTSVVRSAVCAMAPWQQQQTYQE